MNLYKISVSTVDEGTIQVWAGTQYDARQIQKQLAADYPELGKPVVEDVNFPTDKPNLLIWLNINFSRDNG